MEPDIRVWADEMVQLARTFFERDGFLAPVFLGIDGNKSMHIIPANFGENGEHKDDFRRVLSSLTMQKNFIAILGILESNMVNSRSGVSLKDYQQIIEKYGSLAKHPDSFEVVYITLETRNESYHMTIPIKDKKLGESQWEKAGSTKGRFTNILLDNFADGMFR